MTGINPINVNTQGIGARTGFGAQPKAESKEKEKAELAHGETKKQVAADKVLDYMAASSASVVPVKTIDPSKYVDSESAARIASFMGSFEDKVAEGLKAFEAEFPGHSEKTAMAVVLKKIDKEA